MHFSTIYGLLQSMSNVQQKSRLLIVGDVLLDRYWSGEIERISPEAPVSIVKIEETVNKLGGAAKSALLASNMGVDVHLLGHVAEDSLGQALKTLLETKQISHTLLTNKTGSTPSRLHVSSQEHHLIHLDFKLSTPTESIDLLTAFPQAAQNADMILLTDFDGGALRPNADWIAAANATGKPVVYAMHHRSKTIENNNLLVCRQFDFKVKHATVTAICQQIQKNDLSKPGIKAALADLKTQAERQFGVGDLAQIHTQISHAQNLEEKVVFTNGCFDLMHAGHVECLEKARAMGDRLVVAVNTDDSIQRLKGETRPILPLADRMKVLAALDCVDWVVPFDEDTPLKVIETLRPNILAKGGDYNLDTIVGAQSVMDRGGSVEAIVHDFADRSTSGLIATIQGIGDN